MSAYVCWTIFSLSSHIRPIPATPFLSLGPRKMHQCGRALWGVLKIISHRALYVTLAFTPLTPVLWTAAISLSHWVLMLNTSFPKPALLDSGCGCSQRMLVRGKSVVQSAGFLLIISLTRRCIHWISFGAHAVPFAQTAGLILSCPNLWATSRKMGQNRWAMCDGHK